MPLPYYTTLRELVDSLEFTAYKDGHDLTNNEAFIALKREAEKEEMLPSDRIKTVVSLLSNLEDKACRITTGNISHSRESIKGTVKYLKQVLQREI